MLPGPCGEPDTLATRSDLTQAGLWEKDKGLPSRSEALHQGITCSPALTPGMRRHFKRGGSPDGEEARGQGSCVTSLWGWREPPHGRFFPVPSHTPPPSRPRARCSQGEGHCRWPCAHRPTRDCPLNRLGHPRPRAPSPAGVQIPDVGGALTDTLLYWTHLPAPPCFRSPKESCWPEGVAPRHTGRGQATAGTMHSDRDARMQESGPRRCTPCARLGREGPLRHMAHPPGPKFMVRKGGQTQNKTAATQEWVGWRKGLHGEPGV